MIASTKELRCIAASRKFKDNSLIRKGEKLGLNNSDVFFFTPLLRLFFNKKSGSKNKMLLIHKSHEMDNIVSETKSFSQLWSDKGLWDENFDCTLEERKECIYTWFNILYENSSALEEIEQMIINRQSEVRRTFYEEEPNGHISMAAIHVVLPEEIDTRLGLYIP